MPYCGEAQSAHNDTAMSLLRRLSDLAKAKQ
jgi:hypothetical protein